MNFKTVYQIYQSLKINKHKTNFMINGLALYTRRQHIVFVKKFLLTTYKLLNLDFPLISCTSTT